MFKVTGIYVSYLLFRQTDNQIDDESILDEEPCYGKRCTANEHCCPASVCVDVDGGKFACSIYIMSQTAKRIRVDKLDLPRVKALKEILRALRF